jgi:hypothetical protein
MALDADRGAFAVPADYGGVVVEGHQPVLNRGDDLPRTSSGQVGAADRASEERVARQQQLVRREMEADAPLRVSGGVQDDGGEGFEADDHSVDRSDVRSGDLRGLNTQPAGLDVHHVQQGQVTLVEQDRSAGCPLELESAADVVDVGVGHDDLLESQAMAGEPRQYLGNIVAGVNDHCFAGSLVTEDRTIATQDSDRKSLKNHRFDCKGRAPRIREPWN